MVARDIGCICGAEAIAQWHLPYSDDILTRGYQPARVWEPTESDIEYLREELGRDETKDELIAFEEGYRDAIVAGYIKTGLDPLGRTKEDIELLEAEADDGFIDLNECETGDPQGALRKLWDALDGPILRVVDEDGENAENAAVRHVVGDYFLHVDDVDGFRFLMFDDLARLEADGHLRRED